jgi:uncharacterized protein
MRKYLKESLHWLHLAAFQPITLEDEAAVLSRKQSVLIHLRVLPVQLVVVVSVVALIGVLFEFAGLRLDWQKTILTVLIVGLSFGLIGLFAGVEALGVELMFQLVFGLGLGVFKGTPGSFGLGVGFGVMMGWCLEMGIRRDIGPKDVPKPIDALVWSVVGGLFGGPVFALLFLGLGFLERLSGLPSRLVMVKSWREIPLFGVGFAVAFLFAYLRPFYIVPYAFQRWRSKRAADPFAAFLNSPVYWDEAIVMPLPYLSDWLVRLAMFDRQRGMSEFARVARLPHQRWAAQRAPIAMLAAGLQHAKSFEEIAYAPEVLAALPSYAKLAALPSYAKYGEIRLDYVARHIRRVADLARDYATRVTTVGQLNVLRELRTAVESFRDAMVLVKPPLGPAFESAAVLWLDIVNAGEAQCLTRMEPIPNPFVVGNPLMVRDHKLFKGRKDIIVAIEENIINPAQRPALLLYGRRRIGKTSTLLNLPSLLSSQFVPVFIDCQDAKWREGDTAFCYHLAASIHNELIKRELVEKDRRPQLEHFERYTFTRLGEYLDQIEDALRAPQKQILLTFDEYEKLEPGSSDSKVSTEVLNQLRTIVQHRERIVVLFSGSHRFEEMKTINWSDYLINVKTLELTFLAPEDARELITEPVPLVQYESGVIEQIVELTHCQPYLLQAVASDLVNYLNSEKRMLATAADLDVAVEKVLVTVQSYFFYTWTGDCDEPERQVLRVIATGDTNSRTLTESQASLQSLCHKEILERQESGYRFSIELFRRWVLKNQTAQPLTPGDLSEPAELEYTIS